jgi:hypothetical protein
MTAEYALTTEYDPHAQALPWSVTIKTADEGFPVANLIADTEAEAITRAREWVRAETAREAVGRTFYVDENGADAAGPTSTTDGAA